MSNALKWAGYFAIITGIIIAIYLITSLKVIDINAIDYEAPHPYRWLYAALVLAVTTPVGLLSVSVSGFVEKKSYEFKMPEDSGKTDYLSRNQY
jgi:hypothetical protein